VRYAVGPPSRSGLEGTELGVGHMGETFALSNGGSAWFGLAQDPFWGDAVALFAFNRGLADNQYRPELFSGAPGNLLAGRNVTAIALQVPDVTFGGIDVALWARISLYGHAPQRQVSRAAHPLLRSFFFPRPGADTEALNAASPADDVAAFGDVVRRAAAHVAGLTRAANPDGHAATLVAAFLPDLLRYRPGALRARHRKRTRPARRRVRNHAVAAGRPSTRRNHLALPGGARIPAPCAGRARRHPRACGHARAA